MSVGTQRADGGQPGPESAQEPPRRHAPGSNKKWNLAFASLIACYVMLSGYTLFTVLGWSCQRDGQCPHTGRGPGTARTR